MTIAKIEINAEERLLVSRKTWLDIGSRSAETSSDHLFLILVRRIRKKTGLLQVEVAIPVAALRELESALRIVSTSVRVSIGEGRHLVTAPRARGATLFGLVVDGEVRRIVRLGRPQRRQLAVAVEHARAALYDPTLAEELLPKEGAI